MEDTDIEDHTPKPMKPKVNVKHVMESESEDENPPSEIGDDDYVTPKAFQKKASNFLSDSNSNLDSVDFGVHRGRKSKDESNESEEGSDIYVPMNKLGKKDEANKQRGGDVQELQSIDLGKVQIKAKGTKEKRAFRMEVERSRAVVGKTERKVCCFVRLIVVLYHHCSRFGILGTT